MLAHQVAGKAARDSFFLSNYPASDLPKMAILAAVTTVGLVLLVGRAMGRFGPQRLVPAGFLLSSVLHVAEYRVLPGNPALWSVVIYVHIVALGAILLSGFWSVMAESFDPHSAKRIFGRVSGAGTLGGIAGGLMAERIAAMSSAGSVLLLLAILHLACAGVLASFRTMGARRAPSETEKNETISPLGLFRRAPYLGYIAVLVLTGTTAAAVLDYLFKSGAGAAIGKGAPLLRFFAIFYTSIQVVTFFAQTFLAPRSLQRFGIGRTLRALPFGVGGGVLGAMLAPIFPVFAGFRALESGLRGSLYRAGYELLFTPIPQAEKRAAKTLIDVACDRAGDALGSGIVQLMLWFGAAFVPSGLLGAVLVLSAAGVWAASRLDAAYSVLVQQRLVDRAAGLELEEVRDSSTRTVVPRTTSAEPFLTRLDPPFKVAGLSDPVLDMLNELRSEDAGRVIAALKGTQRLKPVLVAQLVSLLAWDEVSEAVRQVLQSNPRPIAGLLVDHLVNPDEVTFGIRRRIPRILARCDSQLAVHGLIAGLSDVRFEVRFQCARALDSLVQRRPDLDVPAGAVFAAVERELQVARPIRNSRRLLDPRDGSDPNVFLDDILRERADQTLEQVFSLFAAVLPREPVRIAFRALHTDDNALRGLALEYLDSVLPAQVRKALWGMIEAKPMFRAPDAGRDPVSELLSAHESLLLQLNRTPSK